MAHNTITLVAGSAMVFFSLVTVSACSTGGDVPMPDQRDVPATIRLSSTAFADGEDIPEQYTCDGADVSPPLAWSNVPQVA